ncbi:MAG: neutral/alkaline non-lysosomal ceramidase N-terminal domain-containing protein [Bacteroidales bacterium]|nr:neutral/alkaline non-lysosomal ceramidase N-terminal domain-containing protein [Bacteroidales bacterium]
MNTGDDNISEGRFSAVPLAGYGDRKGKPATGIHDTVYVKAVAIRTGGKTIVMIGADLLIMPPNITDSVGVLLAHYGIGREQIFFSATHSHSSLGAWGPGFVGEQFAGKENKNLEKWLSQQIAKAVTLAMADLKPARAGYGCFDAGIYTRNRLIGESGTKNDEFCFLSFEQYGKKKAIIGSFSAHATTLGDDNMEISADYPGYWERRIEKATSGIALFCAGSMGSQSPVGEGNGFEKSRFIGEALADSLISHLKDVRHTDKIVFSALSLKMSLPEYHMRISTKINLTSFLSAKLMPPPNNVYLQAARIDKMVWITTPADFSGEYALQIKNALSAKGFHSNITSFNGNYVGYIIPGRYFYLDEYESKLMGWFGPNMGEYTVDLIGRITKIVTKNENL